MARKDDTERQVPLDPSYQELRNIAHDPAIVALVTSKAVLPYVLSEQLRIYNQTLALIAEKRANPSQRGRLVSQACKLAESIRKLRGDYQKQAGGTGVPTHIEKVPSGTPTPIRRDEHGMRIVK